MKVELFGFAILNAVGGGNGFEYFSNTLSGNHAGAARAVVDRRTQAVRNVAKTKKKQARIAAALNKADTGDYNIARVRHIG